MRALSSTTYYTITTHFSLFPSFSFSVSFFFSFSVKTIPLVIEVASRGGKKNHWLLEAGLAKWGGFQDVAQEYSLPLFQIFWTFHNFVPHPQKQNGKNENKNARAGVGGVWRISTDNCWVIIQSQINEKAKGRS